MTLIITELSEIGIVMVGDTAQTVESLNADHTIGDRAFAGPHQGFARSET